MHFTTQFPRLYLLTARQETGVSALQCIFILRFFKNNFAILLQRQHETKDAYNLSNGKAEWLKPHGFQPPGEGLLWVRLTLVQGPLFLLPIK